MITSTAKETLMTTKQIADQLNTSTKVVLENARKCLPNKKIENGKPTYWNEAETTILLDCMKKNPITNSKDLYVESKGSTSTNLSPALKMKQAFDLMNEAYQEEIVRLKQQNIEVVEENGKLKLEKKELVEDCRHLALANRNETIAHANANYDYWMAKYENY
jgi:hypothetical protein